MFLSRVEQNFIICRDYSGKITSKELDALNAALQEIWTTETLLRCQNCNRTFLPEKLKIHNRSCTAANPARRVDEPVKRGNDNDYDAAYTQDLRSNYGDEVGGNLIKCKDCGRSFNAVSFPKYSTYQYLIAPLISYHVAILDTEKYARKYLHRSESHSTRPSKG
jgi:hypothetical protein